MKFLHPSSYDLIRRNPLPAPGPREAIGQCHKYPDYDIGPTKEKALLPNILVLIKIFSVYDKITFSITGIIVITSDNSKWIFGVNKEIKINEMPIKAISLLLIPFSFVAPG